MGKEDGLIIGYDQAKGLDHTCLLVLRKHRDELTVINEFFDEEAEEIYNKLIKRQDIEKG